MSYEEIPLNDNKELHNFELFVEGKRAFIDYRRKDNIVFLVHTEVPKELEGRGIAGAMVEKTFRYLEKNGLKIVPMCTYVKAYLKKHPEWNRLIEETNG